ncbi:hypothetical protein R4144_04595 [Gordonia amicalis]|uniref:hypothetical protein n=1 Tax=Gordonia amicalis TaxID=89053 RepID=UPI002954D237|nr:hypothetical protein [Gordonia amicalis]MDV7172681.1 hypothetical protein [Gordonia amicalis]
MSWQRFTDEYASGGTIRLGSWSVAPARQDLVECRATIAIADRIRSCSAVAAGPLGAMTSILYDLGAPVQILRLHQREIDGAIATFLLCENNGRQAWAFGEGSTGDEANIAALVSGANRLLGPAPK